MSDQGHGLARKMVEVARAVGGLKKDGYNAHHKYKFVSHDSVVNAVRNALADNGVNFSPSVLDVQQNGKSYLVQIEFTFTDSETGESEKSLWFGEGQDAQDKGLYKALTQAKKTFLLNRFLIPTGEQYADGDYGQGYEKPETRKPKAEPKPEPAPEPQRFADLPKTRQDKARAKLFALAGDLGVDAYEVAGHLLQQDDKKGRPSLSASTMQQVADAIKLLQKLEREKPNA